MTRARPTLSAASRPAANSDKILAETNRRAAPAEWVFRRNPQRVNSQDQDLELELEPRFSQPPA